MKLLLLGLMAIVIVALVAFLMAKGDHALNAINSAGTREDARVRRVAETALTLPHLLVSKGTTAGLHVIACAATGAVPIGFALDEAAAGENVGVEMGFGSTVLGVASAAIAADVPVYTAANGKLTSTGGTGKYLVGRSVTAAGADGDEFELIPCFPVVQA